MNWWISSLIHELTLGRPRVCLIAPLCNTRCNTCCKTHCTIHCNPHYNPHRNTLQHTLQLTLQHIGNVLTYCENAPTVIDWLSMYSSVSLSRGRSLPLSLYLPVSLSLSLSPSLSLPHTCVRDLWANHVLGLCVWVCAWQGVATNQSASNKQVVVSYLCRVKTSKCTYRLLYCLWDLVID